MKAGEHKGIKIYFSDFSEQFWTSLKSPVKDLIADSYKDIVKQIDAKLEEKEKIYRNLKFENCSIADDDFPKEYRGYKIYVETEPDTSPFPHSSTFKRFNSHYYRPHKDCKHYFSDVGEMKKIIDEHIIYKNIQKLSQKNRNIIRAF